jgi:hypothetical protein
MDILTHVNKKRHLWIGLGWIKKKPAGSFNPATQSTFFKTPPRLPKSSHALLQKSRSMMLAVLDLYHQDIVKNKQADDDDDKNDNLEVNKGNDRDKMDKNIRNLAPVILEQISNEDKSTDPVEAIKENYQGISGCKAKGTTIFGYWRRKSMKFVSDHFQSC